MKRPSEVNKEDYTKELAKEWLDEAYNYLFYAELVYNKLITGDPHGNSGYETPEGITVGKISHAATGIFFVRKDIEAEIEAEKKEEVKV